MDIALLLTRADSSSVDMGFYGSSSSSSSAGGCLAGGGNWTMRGTTTTRTRQCSEEQLDDCYLESAAPWAASTESNNNTHQGNATHDTIMTDSDCCQPSSKVAAEPQRGLVVVIDLESQERGSGEPEVCEIEEVRMKDTTIGPSWTKPTLMTTTISDSFSGSSFSAAQSSSSAAGASGSSYTMHHLGSASSPIVLDSDGEGEGGDDDVVEEVMGPLTSPISVVSDFSDRSIFDEEPPYSAISVLSTDSFIPNVSKEVIDLTEEAEEGEETPNLSRLDKGKGRAAEVVDVEPAGTQEPPPPPVEFINIENIVTMEPQYFEDDMVQVDLGQTLLPSMSMQGLTEQGSSSSDYELFREMALMKPPPPLISVPPTPAVVIPPSPKVVVEQTSPITKLPTEVLWIIFDFAFPAMSNSVINDPGCSKLRIAQAGPSMRVCQRWRWMLMRKMLKAITVSECTFLEPSAACHSCSTPENRHLVNLPIVRSLYDGNATADMVLMADAIKSVAISPNNCTRRHQLGEDSLESGFIFFLPSVEAVHIPSNLVASFMNGSSAQGQQYTLTSKFIQKIKIQHNTGHGPCLGPTGLIPARHGRSAHRGSNRHSLGSGDHPWIELGDVRVLEIDGECLPMCTGSGSVMPLIEELSIDRRTGNEPKQYHAPSTSILCQFLSNYNLDSAILSRVTIRWLPKPTSSFNLSQSMNAGQEPCICAVLASIPSLRHLDASAICPLLFAKKVGQWLCTVKFEYLCPSTRTRPPPAVKFANLRSLLTPANEMRTRLMDEGFTCDRESTILTLASVKSRDMPHLVESSLATMPSYSIDLGKKLVRVTEFSAKAAAKYRIYIQSLIARSTASIQAREPKEALSEYAIAARMQSLTENWWFSGTPPPPPLPPVGGRKSRTTTVWKWEYDVDLEVFMAGAATGNEFMVLGRCKDKFLNNREAEERKAKRAEIARAKAEAAAAAAAKALTVTGAKPKRSRKRKADDGGVATTGGGKKAKTIAPVIDSATAAAVAGLVSLGSINTSTTVHSGMIQILWA